METAETSEKTAQDEITYISGDTFSRYHIRDEAFHKLTGDDVTLCSLYDEGLRKTQDPQPRENVCLICRTELRRLADPENVEVLMDLRKYLYSVIMGRDKEIERLRDELRRA